MKNKQIYYHILEHGNCGNIGWQGYETTEEQATKRISDLSKMFPDLYFEMFTDTSENEPPITTI